MPPAQKGHLFSVQDVIAAVQNGESDFEMDSDDTDASDSENEDAGEMDKENHQPIDCPANDDVDIKPQPKKHTVPRDRFRWLKKEFISPNTDFSGSEITNDATTLLTPLEYFQTFVTEDMIEALTRNTNEYSLQKNGTSVNTNNKEIEKMLGMYLKMGLMQMSGVRMYWETDTRYTPVSDVMSRNRFQSLLTSLHFTNNLTVSEMEKKDKLWKLRPWLNSFRERCLQVVPEEHNSVDEMMIPFKGRFSNIKQYMRGKPHPWGFKLWVRTGISGMLCDFDVYQGSVDGIRQAKSELGLSGDLLDSFAAKYKFPMKSHRWYIYIFWHTIILAVINAWLLYKRDCKALKMTKKEILNRRQFQAQLATSLILVNTHNTTPKRGRPSSGKTNTFTQKVTSGSPLDPQKRPSSTDVSPPAKRSSDHPPLDFLI
ncbi:piggyBac transposable element-derived protein 3-like, partial [Sinocyclocheilus anshuiensis]|uniref:piggyBac transposable element-derived protein 3-like n=1 Tax=Sinocyclocheilus anshuiensis TaxID=1608454 RepID=UPI0007BA0D84